MASSPVDKLCSLSLPSRKYKLVLLALRGRNAGKQGEKIGSTPG